MSSTTDSSYLFDMDTSKTPLHHSIDSDMDMSITQTAIDIMSSRILSSDTLDNDSTSTSAASTGKSSANLFAEISSAVLLFLLIFGMSGTVNTRNLRRQLRNKYAIGIGLAMQFLIMPFLGYIAVMVLSRYGLTTPMGIMVLMVTTSPGGSYSNWWCSMFNADLALSVAMTALSTILSMMFLPANLLFYSHLAYGFNNSEEQNVLKSVDFPALFISISIVICGIVAGLVASHKMQSATFQKTANALGSVSGIALIVFSAVFSTTSGGEDTKPWQQPWSFYIGVLLPCLGGLLVSNLLARGAKLNKPECVTLSVECCYQNVGIATSAALGMFDDSKEIAQALAVPLLYGIMEAVILGAYCFVAWKLGWTKAPKEEKICVVLTKTFEVDDTEDDSVASIEQDVIESMDIVCSMSRTKTEDSKFMEEGRVSQSRDRLESAELTVASTLSDLGDTSRASSSRRSTTYSQNGHASGLPRSSTQPDRCPPSPRKVKFDEECDMLQSSPSCPSRIESERRIQQIDSEDCNTGASEPDLPQDTPSSLKSRIHHSQSFQTSLEVTLTTSHSTESRYSHMSTHSNTLIDSSIPEGDDGLSYNSNTQGASTIDEDMSYGTDSSRRSKLPQKSSTASNEDANNQKDV